MIVTFENTTNKLKIKNFESNKGIILVGGNGAGKTKKLQEFEHLNRNSKYLKINSIKKTYEELLNKVEDTRQNDEEMDSTLNQNSQSKLYSYIKNSEEKIKNILKDKFSINFKFDNFYRDFRYNTKTENVITSDGHLNIIYMVILTIFFANDNFKILILDEPNTNLSDKNSKKILNVLQKICENEILILASTNIENLILNLEGYLICNIETKDIAFSSDLIGNNEEIDRIINNYESQKKLSSQIREHLLKIYYNNLSFFVIEKKWLILTCFPHGNVFPVLDIQSFTKIEMHIYNTLIHPMISWNNNPIPYDIDEINLIATKRS